VKRILHSAIDKVYNLNNLSEASRKVMRNKGSGGVDRMSVEKCGNGGLGLVTPPSISNHRLGICETICTQSLD